ncbi:hypothetical protein OK016_00240 [Vibrio chagasii]|nr:hypothetical protein [Vibrio chagasii]
MTTVSLSADASVTEGVEHHLHGDTDDPADGAVTVTLGEWRNDHHR